MHALTALANFSQPDYIRKSVPFCHFNTDAQQKNGGVLFSTGKDMDFTLMLKVFLAILETFVFCALGAFAVKRRMMTADSLAGLSRFAIYVLTPVLIFATIFNNFSKEQLTGAWIFPAISFGTVVLHALAGFLLMPLLRYKTPARKATFMHLAAINNFMFLPLIIVQNLWNNEYVASLLLMSVGSTVAQWTIGIAVMGGTNFKQLIRNILSVNLIAALFAVICLFAGVKLPGFVTVTADKVGALAVPLSLILTGASIYLSGAKLTNYPGDMLYTLAVRLIILPLLTLAVIKLLPLDTMARDLAIVLSVMPASAASVLIVRDYGGDTDFAGQMVLSTTLASIITVPVLLVCVL